MYEETEKRNCGHTGPTTPEGRAISSQNSLKHGAHSKTLILPGESAEAWQILLNRWLDTYYPVENTLEYDFVLKTAQAEWHRLRLQRYYDSFLLSLQDSPPHDWTPEQTKKHDLALRYKTAAERAFQREYRLLEQHYKIHRPASTPVANKRPEDRLENLQVIGEDDDSPTGYVVCHSNSEVKVKEIYYGEIEEDFLQGPYAAKYREHHKRRNENSSPDAGT